MKAPRIGVAALAGLLSLGAIGPVAATAPSQAAALAQAAGAVDPAVAQFEVNGLEVILKSRPGSQTVAAGLFIKGGSQNVTPATAGLEALMLDVATEASEHYPLAQFRRELARTGTVVSSGINYDYSAFTLGCTRDHFDSAWALFTDAALHPSFLASDFTRVRDRRLVGLEGADDVAEGALATLMSDVIYAHHPYAADPSGTLESVRSLTVDDMKALHKRLMVTSRLLLVMVGDLTPADVRAKVQAAFGAVPKGDYRWAPPPTLAFDAPTVLVRSRDLPTNYIQGVYGAPSPASEDLDAMRIANAVLRGRVFDAVRTRRALSYAPDAFLSSQAANIGGVSVTAVDVNQTVSVMLREIDRLRTREAPDEEVHDTIRQFLTTYYVGQETNAAQAGTLANAELIGSGWKSAETLLDRITAVTPADVRRVAARYMRNLQFVVLGPATDVDKSIFLQGGGLVPAGAPAAPVFAFPPPRVAVAAAGAR
ncbi:MAG: pitrilysin family protein [Vicinamibacterales bacterium]